LRLFWQFELNIHRQGIIPAAIKEDVLRLFAPDKVRPDFFHDQPMLHADEAYRPLKRIVKQTEQAADLSYHECSWNTSVHAPLLQLMYSEEIARPRLAYPLDLLPVQEESESQARALLVCRMAVQIWGEYVGPYPGALEQSP
jgi:hypothetical protein